MTGLYRLRLPWSSLNILAENITTAILTCFHLLLVIETYMPREVIRSGWRRLIELASQETTHTPYEIRSRHYAIISLVIGTTTLSSPSCHFFVSSSRFSAAPSFPLILRWLNISSAFIYFSPFHITPTLALESFHSIALFFSPSYFSPWLPCHYMLRCHAILYATLPAIYLMKSYDAHIFVLCRCRVRRRSEMPLVAIFLRRPRVITFSPISFATFRRRIHVIPLPLSRHFYNTLHTLMLLLILS